MDKVEISIKRQGETQIETVTVEAPQSYSDYTMHAKEDIFGGVGDTIIPGLSPAEISSEDFSVHFSMNDPANIVEVDVVSVEVFYAYEVDYYEDGLEASSFTSCCVGPGDQLVVIGGNGTILVSDDFGETWARVSSTTSLTLHNIKYSRANGYTVVGSNGCILVSSDGYTWTRIMSKTNRPLLALTKTQVIAGVDIALTVDDSEVTFRRIQ